VEPKQQNHLRAAAPEPGAPAPQDVVLPDGMTSPRVLIIDDEPTIRIAMRRFFARMDWEVEEASNGDVALRMLLDDAAQEARPRYALVVSDLRMPGINGIELYERLKAAYPGVLRRLVFSTGDLVSEEAADFVSSTDCVVLQKPFELATLRTTITQVLADADR
jgi:CheY-like chemotaxis protein